MWLRLIHPRISNLISFRTCSLLQQLLFLFLLLTYYYNHFSSSSSPKAASTAAVVVVVVDAFQIHQSHRWPMMMITTTTTNTDGAAFSRRHVPSCSSTIRSRTLCYKHSTVIPRQPLPPPPPPPRQQRFLETSHAFVLSRLYATPTSSSSNNNDESEPEMPETEGGRGGVEGEGRDPSIEELYRIAMEQDEEWYNQFVRDVLGGDDPSSLCLDETTTSYENKNVNFKKDNDSVGNNNNNSDSKLENDDDANHDGSSTVRTSAAEIGHESDEDTSSTRNSTKSVDEIMTNVTKSETLPPPPPAALPLVQEQQQQQPSSTSKQSLEKIESNNYNPKSNFTTDTSTNDSTHGVTSSEEDDSMNVVVQYTDMFDRVQRVPMSILKKLGYDMADVSMLQAGVLELILEDEIPMPKGGIPTRWLVEGYDSREVRILQKRNKKVGGDEKEKDRNYIDDGNGRDDRDDENEDGVERRRRSVLDNSRRENRRRRRSSREEDVSYNLGRQSSSRRQRSPPSNVNGIDDRSMQQRQQRRQDRRSSSVWMDVPTFKEYLRREADLRLMILGTDWEDWVKGESEWRLNLYKKWLDIVENGIGNDIMEDLSVVPPEERQRQSTSSDGRAGKKVDMSSETPRERRARASSSDRVDDSIRMNGTRQRRRPLDRNIVGSRRASAPSSRRPPPQSQPPPFRKEETRDDVARQPINNNNNRRMIRDPNPNLYSENPQISRTMRRRQNMNDDTNNLEEYTKRNTRRQRQLSEDDMDDEEPFQEDERFMERPRTTVKSRWKQPSHSPSNSSQDPLDED